MKNEMGLLNQVIAEEGLVNEETVSSDVTSLRKENERLNTILGKLCAALNYTVVSIDKVTDNDIIVAQGLKIDSLEAEKIELEKRHNKLVTSIHDLEKENMILEEACNNKDGVIAQATERHNALIKTNSEYYEKIAKLTEINDSLNENVLVKEVDILKEKLSKMTKNCEVAINKAKSLYDERIELKEKLEEARSFIEESSKEQALDNEPVVEVDYKDALEEVLVETAKEMSVELDKDIEEDMSKVASFICSISATKIQPILDADYRDVIDTLVSTIDGVADKYIDMLGKGKVKDQSENISAVGRVKSLLTFKRDEIEEEANVEEKDSLLSKLGALVKSIFAKALKVLLATGKLIGKASIIVSTLIAKVAVYTLTETVKAGTAILTIAVEDYKEAIR